MRYWNPNECVLILMVMLVLAMSMFKHYQNCHNIVTQMSSYCHNSMVDYATYKNLEKKYGNKNTRKNIS